MLKPGATTFGEATLSMKCMIWAWAQNYESTTELAVLLAIADIARDSGLLWASHAYIASKTRQSPRTVRSVMTNLQEATAGRPALIRVQERPGRTDLTYLLLTPVTIFPDGPDEELVDRGKPRRPTPATGARTPAAGADEPKEEPVKNRSSLRSESAPVADLQLDGGSVAIDAQAYPPDAFEQWYRIYPRKAGRDQARKTFAKVVKEKRVGFADLMKATAEFKEIVSLRGDKDVHFTPHPSTWLNAGSWADDLDFERRAADAHARTPTERRGLETAHNLGGLYAASQAAVLAKQVQRGRDPGDTE